MAQEFTINSSAIESKINQLLPSQGGFGAGVDFSASTMVIPIVDLTETAEGSDVRADLQTSFSFNNTNSYAVANASTTLINTTGYFRILGNMTLLKTNDGATINISITDGVSSKILINGKSSQLATSSSFSYDFTVFLGAGDSIVATSTSVELGIVGITRQIADISGNLIQPI